MQRMKKRALSTLLALVMILGLFPVAALAAEVPVITTQPSSVTAANNSTATFSIVAEDADSYQWQYRLSSTSNWKNSGATGSKTATLKVTAKPSFDGYQYRCAVKNDAGTVYSNAVTLNVAAPGTILTQPEDKLGMIGFSATFKISAVGVESYQWQYRTSSTGSWKNSGATGSKTDSLKVTVKANFNGYDYRCRVTATDGSVVYSNPAKLSVYGVTTQPTSQSVDVGETAKFSVVAVGNDLAYQWQYRISSTGSWKNSGSSGNKTAGVKLTAKAYHNGYQFRCKLTTGEGKIFYSKAATLTVEDPSMITDHPSDVSAAIGSKATFTVTAVGAESYQWQYRTSSTGSWVTSGATGNKTATLKAPVLASRDGYQYRCLVTSASGAEETSNAATLSVYGVSVQPEDQSVDVGEVANFTVTALGDDLSYVWQYSKPSAPDTWKNSGATGNKTASLKVTASAGFDGYQFRCKITDGEGHEFYSDAAVLNVSKPLTITSHPVNAMADPWEEVSFSVAVSGGKTPYTYQWQYSYADDTEPGGRSEFAPVGNLGINDDAAQLTYTADIADFIDEFRYRCVITDANGETLTSAEVWLEPTPLTITSQPVPAYAELGTGSGEYTWFRVEFEGGFGPYETVWQYSNVVDDVRTPFRDITESISENLYTGYDDDDLGVIAYPSQVSMQYRYRCVITDGAGRSVTSDEVWIKEYCAPNVSINSDSVKALEGDVITLSVEVIDEMYGLTGNASEFTYQWQYKTKNMDEFVDLTAANEDFSGWNTNELQFEAGVEHFADKYEFRCVVSDNYGFDIPSSEATLISNVEDLTIQTQPADVQADEEDTVTFTVVVQGGQAPYAYQWQWDENKDGTFENLTAETSERHSGYFTETLSVMVAAEEMINNYPYRCVVTDYYGNEVTSNSAIIEDAHPLTISAQPKTVAAASGSSFTFTVAASGGGTPYSCKWEYCTSLNSVYYPCSELDWCSGTGTPTLTVNKDVADLKYNSYLFRCKITDAYGNTVTSDPATFKKVNKVLTIETQPFNRYVTTAGDEAVFTTAVSGGTAPYTYQWQYSVNSSLFKDISAANASWAADYTTASLTLTPTTQMLNGNLNTTVRCVITDADGTQVTTTAASVAKLTLA